MPAPKFRSTPRPNSEVITLLETLTTAARQGQIPTIAVVLVNPVNQAEAKVVGELTELRVNALISGLAKVSNNLLK